jgi:hypothetical protein
MRKYETPSRQLNFIGAPGLQIFDLHRNLRTVRMVVNGDELFLLEEHESRVVMHRDQMVIRTK